MSSPSPLSVQMSAIMDVLSKAAVAEISKLVEDEAVVLRLEISRRDAEILELTTSLRLMEADLFKAQESTAKAEDAPECGGFGLRVTDKVEHDFNIPCGTRERIHEEMDPTVKVKSEQEDQIHEQMSPSVKVKSEPVDQRDQPTLMNAANTELTGIDKLAFNPEEDMLSSWSSSPILEDVAIEPTGLAQHGTMTNWNSFRALTPKGSGASLIKEGPQVQPMCTGNTILQSNPTTEFSYLSGEGEGDSIQCRHLIQAGLLQEDLQRWTSFGNEFADNIPSRKPTKAVQVVKGRRSNQNLPQLNNSNLLHGTQKPYKCQECGKSFTHKCRLNSHQSVHTGERPFSCQICGKRFSRQDNCALHVRLHSGVKPYRCETCGKCFRARRNVKIHQEIHRRGQQ